MLTRVDFKKAPHSPGIYFFKNTDGKILYVGKAQNLKLRLLSYANLSRGEMVKLKMLEEANKIEWRELTSNIEALIEEAIAIKRYRPKYNIVFRDDKNYFFVGITKEKFSRVIKTHQPMREVRLQEISRSRISRADFFGPYTDGWAIKSVLRSLQKIFPYCICKEKHKRPCLYSDIGKCLGVCCVKDEKIFPDWEERERNYRKNISAIRKILSGKRKDVIKKLEREMKKFSEEQNFEEALRKRDQIQALDNIFRHRHIVLRELDPERLKALVTAKDLLELKDIPLRIEGYDISNLQGTNAVGSMVVFEEGSPKKSDYRLFKIRIKNTPDDTAMHKEVLLRRLKHDEWPLPDLILIDGGLGQWNAAKKILVESDLNIPLASLAKREEELWLGKDKKIELKKMPPSLLHLFQHIRNESHRFAINFHRDRRSKTLF